jgi:hypothetical protein
MTPDEVLVERGAISTPWPIPPDPQNFMDGRIVPRSWYFPDSSDTPQPYEFAFERHDEGKCSASADPQAHAMFIAELHEVLKNHSLTSILGLVALSPDYLPTENRAKIKCEKTFGRANIVFDVDSETLNEKDTRTSIWTFGKLISGGRESMVCFVGCQCQNTEEEEEF